jgi:8-oxo-dGTP diphosphatase
LIRVVAAVIEWRGRLLICQRRRGDLFEKLRPSESPREGLLRELREELGSSAARIGSPVYRTRHRYKEYSSGVELTFFRVWEVFPAPQNLAAECMLWSRPKDLPRYNFLPADRELVGKLVRGELLR